MAWEKIDNVRGPKGEKGNPGTISSVTSTTVPAGTPARASMTGTTDVNLHLELPQGERGPQGPPGVASSASAKSVAADQPAKVTLEQHGELVHMALELPRGLPGTNAVPTAEAIGANLAAPDSAARPGLETGMQQVAENPSSAFSTNLAARTDAAIDEKLTPAVAGLSGEIAQRPTAAVVQAGFAEIAVSVTQYGAKGDGITDDGPAIQAALDAHSKVMLPPGVYLTNQELKVPSGREFFGAGVEASRIKGGQLLDRGWNVVTNAKNDREYRTAYDENIYLHDFYIDGNHNGRPAGTKEWAGNASGVFLSTVRHALVERVWVVGAPLHGFSVDASRLAKETEAPEFMVPGPSQHVVIRDCVSIDPVIDDCFTTHYSSDILIERCTAIRTIPVTSGGGVQNGFEVDEGSWRVTVRDCYARGVVYGVQIKGHDTTRPPWDIVIERVTAEGCQTGLLASGTAATTYPQLAGRASNLMIRDFTNLSPVNLGSSQTVPLSAMKIFSYQRVVIENLVTRNSPHGGIVLDRSGEVTIRGVHGEDVWNGPENSGDGFIRVTGDARPNVNVSGVRILGPVTGPIFRNNTGESHPMVVRDLVATATAGATFPMVSDSYLTPYRSYAELQGTGFSKLIEIRAGSGAASQLTSYGENSRGTGSPEGAVIAWPGYQYQSANAASGSALWVKNSGTGATGWKAL